MQAQTITFGYSDSEDRLWIRLVLVDQSEARFWLTRRLTENLCQAMAGLIEQNTQAQHPSLSTQEVNQYLRKEFFEVTHSTWDPTPPPPQATQNNTPTPTMQLCQTINIDLGLTWQLRFSGTRGPEYTLGIEPNQAPKFLLALLKQSQIGHWQVTTDKIWLQNQKLS